MDTLFWTAFLVALAALALVVLAVQVFLICARSGLVTWPVSRSTGSGVQGYMLNAGLLVAAVIASFTTTLLITERAALYWPAFFSVLAANALTVFIVHAVLSYRRGSSFWGTAMQFLSGINDLGLRAYLLFMGLIFLLVISDSVLEALAKLFN